MGQISPCLRNVQVKDGHAGYGFFCPGCVSLHVVSVGPNGWTFDGNLNVPTFSPSVLVTYNGCDAGQDRGNGHKAPPAICHSFVVAGRIQFLGDCTHALAGQTVPLPLLPEDWRD